MQAIRKNNPLDLIALLNNNYPKDKLFFETSSAQESEQYGKHLGKELPLNSIIAFEGELGAGKTTFIKGVVFGAAGLDGHIVNSPTFTYLNIYRGLKTIYHFDLYRLSRPEDFLSMGFDEYLTCGGICCIEWSERIAPFLPANAIKVRLSHKEIEKREITISL